MGTTYRGTVQDGNLMLTEPVALPEGTEVIVRVEPAEGQPSEAGATEDFTALPFIGMWADREDMNDSAAWVRRERDKWQQRARQQD
jgi:hypothetical protein